MDLIIKIDEETYNRAKNEPPIICGMNDGLIYQSNMKEAIANGTPLPKGHGRLIDADKLDTRERGNNSQRTMWWNIDRIVKGAPTIVEADMGE